MFFGPVAFSERVGFSRRENQVLVERARMADSESM